MTTKRTAFGVNLMLDEAVEDAIHSDMFFIEKAKLLSQEEYRDTLINAFSLPSETASLIVDNKLNIAIFEAATLVNEGVESLKDVTTLRQLCCSEFSEKGINIISKCVEKYLLFIQLAALGMRTFKDKEFPAELNISRRNAVHFRAALEQQISDYAKTIPWLKEKPKSKDSISFRQSDLLNDIESLLKNIPNPQQFTASKLMVEVSKITETPLSATPDDTKELIFSLANNYIKGRI